MPIRATLFSGHRMHYVAAFFAGAFLCNSVPHLVAGLQGAPFPTPFARPRGVGDSSPLVNFLWGGLNLLAGIFLLSGFPAVAGFNPGFLTLILGALAIGILSAWHFGKVRR